MLAPPHAIAFDLDGTLVDSLDDLAASANHVRAAQGLTPLSTQVVRTYIGNGARRLVQRSLGLADDDATAVDAALAAFRDHYRAHCLDATVPYPGVRETLTALRPLPMAVVTNKPQAFADLVIDGLGLRSFFGSVVGARAGIAVKPAPDLVRLAFAELGIDPAHGWMVGDSDNDLGGGHAAGCQVVMVTYGLGDPAHVDRAAPEAWIDTFDQLLTLRG